MKKTLIALIVLTSLNVSSQKYFTKTGSIDFLSKTPMEKIEGNNKALASLLDSQTGSLDFIVQIKSFVFDRQLLQEHFNENYMESNKYPKATFKGKIDNIKDVNFAKDGDYDVTTSGKLTIHGVTKDVKQKGKVSVKSGKVIMNANFSIVLEDYNVTIPGAVKDKISKDVKVNLNCILDQMK